MKNFIVIALMSILSVSSYADIEGFNEKQLEVYTKSGLDKKSESEFNRLNLDFKISDYATNIINRQSSDKEIKRKASEQLSSWCYDASISLNIRLSDCLVGDITSFSKNYILYKYTLMNKK